MNRVIKFRAWEGEEMVTEPGFIQVYGDGSYAVFIDQMGEWYEKDCQLMQFTGLTDKNGKEIYEGDIVKYHSNTYGESHKWKIAEVCFYHSYYGFKDEKWFYDESLTTEAPIPDLGPKRLKNIPSGIWESDLEQCAVIGNIFENPELLNKKQEAQVCDATDDATTTHS